MLSIPYRFRPAVRRGTRARAPTLLGVALALLIGLAALALRATAAPGRASLEPASPIQRAPVSASAVPGAAVPGFPAAPPELDAPALPVPAQPGSSRLAGSPLTGIDPRGDAAAHLREILRVREEAFGRRDMRLLETVYTADCPCLWSGRAAIARLLEDRAVWRGRAVTIEVDSLQRVTGRMWIAAALLSSRPFRIEREDGTLIRVVPAGRQRYRFVLVRPAPSGRWLLGDASLLGGGAP